MAKPKNRGNGAVQEKPDTKPVDVDGKPARLVIDGTVPKPAPMVEVPIENYAIQIAELDAEINDATIAHNKAGEVVKNLKKRREELFAAVSARGAKLRKFAPDNSQQTFDGIHAAAEADGIDEEDE